MEVRFRKNVIINVTNDYKDGVFPNCLSCINFDELAEFCKKWKMKPPARVIAFACPDYFDTEEIPY